MQANIPISNLDQVATRSHHILQDLTTYDDHTQYVPTDGTRPAKNIQSGTDAGKPASPSVGDIYSATDTGITYNCYSVGVWKAAAFNATSDTFTCSEAIAQGAAVSLGDGSVDHFVTNTTTSTSYNMDDGSNSWIAQTFLVPSNYSSISSIDINFSTSGGAPHIYCSIYATSSGVPTGSPLQSQTSAYWNSSGTAITVNFPFTSNINVVAGTTYALVINAPNSTQITALSYNASQSYASGLVYYGGTGASPVWGSSNAQTIYFNINGSTTIAGQVANSNASTTTARFNNFLGFAATAAAANGQVTVNMKGVDNNQTGLTVGSSYYLTNTNGAIGTTAGTNSLKTGIAVGASMIAIQNTI